MRILVTGAAGFIGYHVSLKLLKLGHEVIGLDNVNGYYRNSLKFDRLKQLGIPVEKASRFNRIEISETHPNFRFIRMNLEDGKALTELFGTSNFEIVIHLAAQAGVRYSLDNPHDYLNSNVIGFLNILECCRHYNTAHLIYASSSSVYGLNSQVPFSIDQKTDTPISIYAATKKSNEHMAHTYSHLFNLRVTGLRFFTVYGPWGRPDMALFLFTDAILNRKPIKVFNNGEMKRDFTYIDDVVEVIIKIVLNNPTTTNNLYNLYNVGNNNPVLLLELIELLEKNLGMAAVKQMLPIQPGDVVETWADVGNLINDYNYSPDTLLEKGIQEFVKWYRSYY